MFPPFTPRDDATEKLLDFNYDFALADVEVDDDARHRPHGWVTARSDGLKAKCGGTAQHCGVCRREAEILQACGD